MTDGDYSSYTDENLMLAVGGGTHAAFAELVNRHSRRFYFVSYRILASKDEAEDVVQQAFLKLWHRPEIWHDGKGAKFTTWFYRVVINMCLDHNKKKRPQAIPEGFEIEDERPGVEDELDRRRQQIKLEKAIRELPERQQLALNLCFYEGVSNKDAARIMAIRLKALQSLLMRAKTSLKTKLQDRSR